MAPSRDSISPAASSTTRAGAALAVLAALLLGCGKRGAKPGAGGTGGTASESDGRPRVDLRTPLAALDAATRALEAGDLAGLDGCMTSEGATRVRDDLAAWHALLVDASSGPRALSRVPPARDEAERAAYAAGLGGDAAGLLRMLARAESAGSPVHADVPAVAPDATRVEAERVLADGTRRRAVLVRDADGWRVDRLAL